MSMCESKYREFNDMFGPLPCILSRYLVFGGLFKKKKKRKKRGLVIKTKVDRKLENKDSCLVDRLHASKAIHARLI